MIVRADYRRDVPIHLKSEEGMLDGQVCLQRKARTGAKGVVCPLELLAWGKVLALCGDALEVVGVVLEAEKEKINRGESVLSMWDGPVPGLVGVWEAG